MIVKALSLSLGACPHGATRSQRRPSHPWPVNDVRTAPLAAPCSAVQGATEVNPDHSDYIDLAEFGLEGVARVSPTAAASTQMDARIRIRKQGHCYGCGVRLQTREPNAVGFVEPIKFEEKLIHRQTDKLLCLRCNELCHGKMVPAVEDFAQKGSFGGTAEALTLNGKALISPEDLRRQLLEVGNKKALVLMLVDLLDVSGTMMTKVRDLVGRNPIILVGTKMDLLPAGCQPKAVAQWLLDSAMRKRLNVVSAHLVSSHTMEGISAVASKACAERKGRDVYVIGAANVGKSAFVRAFLTELRSFQSRNFDAAALSSGKYLPIESAMPGTTLGLIPLQAFASGGTLYDTPGVHLHHRVPHMLSPEELKLLNPRKRLCVYRPPAPADVSVDAADEEDTSSDGSESVSATYEWSDLVRVDVLDGPPSLVLVFHGPHSMQVTHGPLKVEPPRHDVLASQNKPVSRPGRPKKVLSCAKSVSQRGGLVPHDLQVSGTGGPQQAVADIAVSGMPGWVTLWVSHSRAEIKLRVWAVRGVEVFLRPPFPTQLPEQLMDDIATTAAENRPAQSGKGGKAAEVDTSERVKQIFRRYQVEEVKEEDDDPDASQLLAMLKQEVEELETIAPGSQPGISTEDISEAAPTRQNTSRTGQATSRAGPATGRTGPVTSRVGPATGGVGPGSSGAKDTSRSQSSSIQDLSALFGAALEGSTPDSSRASRSLASGASSSSGGTSMSSRRGVDKDARYTESRMKRSKAGSFEEEFDDILLDVEDDGPAVGSKQVRKNAGKTGTGMSDLSSLFGAVLEDSIPEAGISKRQSRGPQSRGQDIDAEAFESVPTYSVRSVNSLTNKNRSKARQLADEQAQARGTYDRPNLFPNSSLVSKSGADSSEPSSSMTSSGVSVSDLAAKYTALSRPSSGATADAQQTAGAEGDTQDVGSQAEVVEETFVFDEDLVREIAAQAKAGGKRRRRVKSS